MTTHRHRHYHCYHYQQDQRHHHHIQEAETTVNYMAVTRASETIHRAYGYTAPHHSLFISDVPS